MTVIVGVNCTDGVVIGCDSAATSADSSGRPLVMVATEKIHIVPSKMIIAGTGSVGLGQRFYALAKRLAQGNPGLPTSYIECAEKITQEAFNSFCASGAHLGSNKFSYGALAALPCGESGELVEFEYGNLQPELKTGKLFFVSMGSGQSLADPFIAFVKDVLWGNERPDVRWGALGVYWALNHTITYAHGGVGGPISLATMKKNGPTWDITCSDDTQEYAQHLDVILEKIGDYPTSIVEGAASEPPPAPAGPD